MPRRKGKTYPSDERWNAQRKKTPPKKAPTARAARAPAPPEPPQPRARPAPRAPSSPAPPDLALLAEERADVGAVVAGLCPSCKAPHADHDRNCARCGSPLRRACPRCKAPTEDGVRFCTGCGTEVPELTIAAPMPAPSSSAPLALVSPEAQWEADDVTLFAAGVDLMLMRIGDTHLTDAERARIDKRTAVMANKYFRRGGRWKDELLWLSSWASPLITAAYIRYVVAPDRAREREAAATAPRPTAPNLETVK